ncbi:MAG: hypothetical protein K1060chlam3_00520 [Candidatus Anoxychlamydiales bacterium]|nr:hypothetical protein [Candidatus Anoxychlamydiales bacterium]
MGLVDIRIRFSKDNVVLEKVTTLNIDKSLVYKNESNDFKTQMQTAIKFSILTAASPLIALARIVRSAAFVFARDFNRAGREFIGGLGAPLITSYCLTGTLLSSLLTLITGKSITLHVSMRRAYSYFEAWINQINLEAPDLVSYSQRASDALNCVGESKGVHKHVWTTAPCMQPVLEKGYLNKGGIFDVARMQKIFPLIKVNRVHREGNDIVLQSKYSDKNVYFRALNGAYEHAKVSTTCCCCYRIEAVYHRLLCCEVGHGNCSSIANSGNSSGIVFCKVCGAMGCCCYETENNELVGLDASVGC